MRAAFHRIKPRAERGLVRRRRKRKRGTKRGPSWEQIRFRQFQARHRSELATHSACARCDGPIAETMQVCPWCGVRIRRHRGDTRFPARCVRCRRGRKLDWRFCAWCYGAAFKQVATRKYSDARYEARCSNPACTDRRLMPFMKYCPWCNRKVKRRWDISGSAQRCAGCGWGVLHEFWEYCPWCSRAVGR